MRGTKKVIVTVALVVAAIGPVLIIVGKVISAVGTIMTLVPKLAGVINAAKGVFAAFNAVCAANPYVLIIAAIVALVAAFIYLWNNCEEFQQFWIDLWESIKEIAIAVWEALKAFFKAAWEAIKTTASAWRNSNPMITAFWWDVDRAVKTSITQRIQTEVRSIKFFYKSGMLFIQLPSDRGLAYVKPRIGTNQFGGESVTYEGVSSTKKWERIESYGPKFVENIVQAISRDILCYAMKVLRYCFIVGHVHDELIIECDPRVNLKAVCKQMSRSPDWMPDILLRADGYETDFYKKD